MSRAAKKFPDFVAPARILVCGVNRAFEPAVRRDPAN